MKKKTFRLMSLLAAAALPFAAATGYSASAENAAPIKVACVGDSITQGLGNTPYPSRLADLLGDGYEVGNYGLWGTTGCNNTGRPYTSCDDSCYQASLDFAPDVVIIMLGTNDGNEASIANAELYFKQDMTSLIRSYQELATKPRVYLVTSPYAYIPGNAEVNTKIVQMQRELAEELQLPLIDMNKLTENMPENFQDGLHPSETGYYIVAQNIYEHAFGGKVADITVKTAPSAKIKLSAYEITADAEGVAKLRMAHGKRLLTVEADNFETAFSTVDITDNCVIDCELMQSVNLAGEGTCAADGTPSENADASKAFDGDLSTGWQNSSKTAGISISTTFDKNRTFSSVKLYWEAITRPGTEEGSYTVEYFDGTDWHPVTNSVYSFGDGSYGVCCDTVTFDSIAAKGARVVINSFTNDKSAAKLYEMAVYNASATDAVITVTAVQGQDGTESGPAGDENGSELPGWVIPVAIAAVAVVIIACAVWVIFTVKNRR